MSFEVLEAPVCDPRPAKREDLQLVQSAQLLQAVIRHALKGQRQAFQRAEAPEVFQSNCQMLWMTACSGGVGLFHPIDKPHPGDHLG
jgi:hypothetical protein